MNQNQLNDATAPRSVDQQQACSAWRRTTEVFPPKDAEVEITHPNFIGTRTARMRDGGWYLTDRTHPAMNCYAPIDGSGWRMKPNVRVQPQLGAAVNSSEAEDVES